MPDVTKSARELADKIVDDLFTDGMGHRADHLHLIRDGKGLGGWADYAVKARLLPIIADYDHKAVINALPRMTEELTMLRERCERYEKVLEKLKKCSGLKCRSCRIDIQEALTTTSEARDE